MFAIRWGIPLLSILLLCGTTFAAPQVDPPPPEEQEAAEQEAAEQEAAEQEAVEDEPAPAPAPVPAPLDPEAGVERAKELNTVGLRARKRGRDEDALAAYREAVAVAPDYVWGRFNLACELARHGRLDETLVQLRALEGISGRSARLALARVAQDHDFDPLRGLPAFEAFAQRWRPTPDHAIVAQLCADPYLAVAMVHKRGGVIDLRPSHDSPNDHGDRLLRTKGERFVKDVFSYDSPWCRRLRGGRGFVDRPLAIGRGDWGCVEQRRGAAVRALCFVRQDMWRWVLAVVAEDSATEDSVRYEEFRSFIERSLVWWGETAGLSVRYGAGDGWTGREERPVRDEPRVVVDRSIRIAPGGYEVLPFALDRTREVHVHGTVRTATEVDFHVMDPEAVTAWWTVARTLEDGALPHLPRLYRESARDLDETAVVASGRYGLVVRNRAREEADVQIRITEGPPPSGARAVRLPPGESGPQDEASGPGRYELVLTRYRVSDTRSDGEPWDVDGSPADVRFDVLAGAGVTDVQRVKGGLHEGRPRGLGPEEDRWRFTWDGRAPVILRAVDVDAMDEDFIARADLRAGEAPARAVAILSGHGRDSKASGTVFVQLAWRRISR